MADSGNAKVLKARIEFDTASASRKLDELSSKINKINKAFSNVASGNNSLNNNLRKSNTQAKNLERNINNVDRNVKSTNNSLRFMGNRILNNNYLSKSALNTFNSTGNTIRNLSNKMMNFGKSIHTTNSAAREQADIFDKIYRTIKGISATYFGMMGLKNLIEVSDNLTAAQNRLNDYNSQQLGSAGVTTDANGKSSYSDKTINATTEQMNKMFVAAQKARTGYDDMMANVSKSMVLAGDSFENNLDNAIRFQEIMGKAYTLGGASAAEQASSMYQMIQALGAGTLAGDELRSVREGAPLAYQAIEEFAQGVYNTEESLKDLASQGKITSDMVVAAMLNAGDSIDDRFSRTAMTFGQAFTMMKNTAIMAFKPVLQYMNEFLNSETGQKALNIINEIIMAVAKGVGIIVRAIGAVITFIVNNWDWIKVLLITGITFIAGFLVAKMVMSITSIIATTLALIASNPVLALVIALGALIVGLIVLIYQQSSNLTEFIANCCFAISAIVLGVLILITAASLATGAIIISIPMLILLIVIGVLSLIGYLFFAHTEEVMGRLYQVGAVFQNVVIFMKKLGTALWETIKAIGKNIEIAFTNAWNGAKSAFWEFIADCLDGLKALEPVINAVAQAFGKEGFSLSGVAEGLHDKANSYKQLDYVDVGAAWSNAWDSYDYKNLEDAYNKGSDKGAAIKDKINNIDFDLGSMLGMDGLGEIPNVEDGKYGLNSSDPASILGGDPSKSLNDIAGSSGKTADNTKNISDSMNILDTDLKYLKELGEREAINKFTTAEIKVEMKNDNYISERVDMDGVVDYLSDRLYEELGVVANGVHY